MTESELHEVATQDIALLNTARGYYGLNMIADAEAELLLASRFSQELPEFIQLWGFIFAKKKEWGRSLDCANNLVALQPENQSGHLLKADAIRHIKYCGPRAAFASLLKVAGQFPDCPVVSYNLGCYAAVNENLFSARRFIIQMLQKAEKTGEINYFRYASLNDEDLKPLWPELGRMKDIAHRLNRIKNTRCRKTQNQN
jgi:hypothetical protein